MFCPYCGAKLEKDSKFCTQCGQMVEDRTEGAGEGAGTSADAHAAGRSASAEAERCGGAKRAGGAGKAETSKMVGGADKSTDPAIADAATVATSAANDAPTPAADKGDLASQISETRRSVRRKMPLMMFVVLVALGIATAAFAATVVWKYVIAPQVEAAQRAHTEEAAAAGAAGTAEAAATTGAAALDDGKVHSASTVQEYEGVTYTSLDSGDSNTFEQAYSTGATKIPVSADSFLIYDGRLYYAAKPTVTNAHGAPYTISGGGIYSANLDGSDAKQLVSDNAFYETLTVDIRSFAFGVSNGRLYYTTMPEDQRSKAMPDDPTSYRVVSVPLDGGEATDVAEGYLQSIGNGILAVAKKSGTGTTASPLAYSYELVDAESGNQLASLDSVLPRTKTEDDQTKISFEDEWLVYLSGNRLIAVGSVGGNGDTGVINLPVVQATVSRDGSLQDIQNTTVESLMPLNDSAAIDYSKGTLALNASTSQMGDEYTSIDVNSLSVSQQAMPNGVGQQPVAGN